MSYNGFYNATIKLTDTSKVNPAVQFFARNGTIVWERCYEPEQIKRIYEFCSPLASFINMAADAFVNGDFLALNSNTENDVRGLKKEWQTLLDRPNGIQESKQFFKQLYTYRKLFGYCYVYKQKAVGFNKPSSLIVLPPWMLRVERDMTARTPWLNKENNEGRRVYMIFNGYELLVPNDDLILFTDNTNTFDEITYLPQSRIISLQSSISIIISILEAHLGLIQQKGALGILSSRNAAKDDFGVTPMDEGEKVRLQEDFNRYGLSREQWKVIISTAALTWQPMVFDVQQLQLNSTYSSAIKDISDGLNYPFVLSAHSDQSTYNNLTAADRRLYQNSIIPDAKSIMATLRYGVGADLDNVMFEADYSDISALQETKKEQGEGLKAMGEAVKILWETNAITRNRMLELLNENSIGEAGNVYYYEFVKANTPAPINNNNNGTEAQIPE